jgi:hypothetical protein
MVKDAVASVGMTAETAEGKRLTISVRIGRPQAGGKLYAEDGAEFPVEAYLSGLGGKPQ